MLPPYAAYAPPGTPQVGLGRPLPTAMAQLPLPPPASLVLTQGQLRKGASPGSQLHSRRICLGPHSLATPFAALSDVSLNVHLFFHFTPPIAFPLFFLKHFLFLRLGERWALRGLGRGRLKC